MISRLSLINIQGAGRRTTLRLLPLLIEEVRKTVLGILFEQPNEFGAEGRLIGIYEWGGALVCEILLPMISQTSKDYAKVS